VLLAVLMLSALLAPCAGAATAENVKHYEGYTVLGDSLASGWGLPEYNQYNELYLSPRRIEGSYGAIVADAVKADNYYPLGTPAFRSADLRYCLDNDYDGDWITENALQLVTEGHYDKDYLTSLRPTFQNAIRNSDLVSVEIGLNDVWYPQYAALLYWLDDVPEDLELEDFDAIWAYELEKFGTVEGVIANLKILIHKCVNIGTYASMLASVVPKLLTDYFTNFRAIIDQIYELNPDITIVAVGDMNTFEGWDIPAGSGFNPWRILDLFYEAMNSYMKSLQDEYGADRYKFADVMGTTLIGDKVTIPFIAFLTLDDSGYNPHPDAEGHQYMAKQILSVLPEDDGSSVETDCPSAKYTDLDTSAWYHEPVDYVLKNGIMTGMSDTTFAPNENVTRAQIVTMLYALDGKPEITGASSFADVSEDAWYAAPVKWAAASGVVAGMGDGTFAPDADVTREQLVTMLRSYANYKAKNTDAQADLTGYSDAGEISSWATENVSWAVAEGLISGRPGNLIAPKDTATRAETATMFRSFCRNVLA